MKQFKLMMLGLALSAGFTTQMQAQEAQSFVHQQSNTEDYVWPTDPQVLGIKHAEALAGPEVRCIDALGTL